MSRSISKQDKPVNDKISGWDKVIVDAEKHIVRLKAAIGHARDMKKSGEPWPEAQAENQTQEPCHSV